MGNVPAELLKQRIDEVEKVKTDFQLSHPDRERIESSAGHFFKKRRARNLRLKGEFLKNEREEQRVSTIGNNKAKNK